MKVKEMFDTFDKDIVLAQLFLEYEDQKQNVEGYSSAWDKIKSLTPTKSEYLCVVYYGKDRFFDQDDQPYFDVYGQIDNETYAIDFSAWGEWLDMEVQLVNKTEREISNEMILAAILYEMTWAGYCQEDIQEKKSEIFSAIEEMEELIAKSKIIERKTLH